MPQHLTQPLALQAARYLVEKAPHQFKDADQYQRSIRMPIGADWYFFYFFKKNDVCFA